jgi:pyridoxamine 5'-phosphate oxidase
VPAEESTRYFETRPRGSRLGAWASRQSEPLASRDELEARVRAIDEKYPGDDVPLPPFWGGYVLHPARIEFWQGKADRLHERLAFHRDGDGWQGRRLYP